MSLNIRLATISNNYFIKLKYLRINIEALILDFIF